MNKHFIISIFFTVILYGLNAQTLKEANLVLPKLAWGDISTADFDLDGDTDLVICGKNELNQPVTRVYRNDNGNFSDINAEIENVMQGKCIWVDLNNDKYPEIIISGKTADNKSVSYIYRNWKNGTFSKVSTELEGFSSGDIEYADFDKDGDLDVLFSGKAGSKAVTKLYKNEGFFDFSETNFDFKGLYNGSVAFIDFNRDGFPDIFIAGEDDTGKFTKLYLNQNGSAFEEQSLEIPQLANCDIACADLNADYNIDVIITGIDTYGNERTLLFENDGKFGLKDVNKTRGFKQPEYVLPNLAYGTINIADLNNDNKPDLIFTGKGTTKKTEIYLNEGNFNFKKQKTGLNGVYHSALAIFDYDKDGKKDFYYMGLDSEDQIFGELFQNKGFSNKPNQTNKKTTIQPNFTFSKAFAGEPMRFVNQTKTIEGKNITFNWNFGDNTDSKDISPKHVFKKEGRYTVTLTATVDGESQAITKVIAARPQQSNAVSLSDREMLILNTKALRMLKDYQDLTNDLGASKNEEARLEYKERIISMFLNRQIAVFNDLDPDNATSKLKEIQTYTSDLILLYPDGITIGIDIDKARMTSVKQHGKSLYSIDLITNKRTDGFYSNKKENARTEKLAFRIAFNKEKSSFTNLKFVGIRDFYETSSTEDVNTLEELNKAEISKIQEEQINNDCKALLNDYIRNLSLIGNPNEDEDDKEMYEMAFLDFFADSTIAIYNDIDPELSENTLLPGDYIKNYRTSYPSGIKSISLSLDSAEFKPIINEGGNYYRYVYVDRNFSGEYKNKQNNNISENLAFKIIFKKHENSFQDFKITSIDQSSLNFYQSADIITEADTVTYTIKSIGRKGFYAGVYSSGGMGTIYNENLVSEQLAGKDLYKAPSMQFSFGGGIEINYFLLENLGFRIGVGYNIYKTEYSINNKGTDPIQDNVVSSDVNNESFYKTLLTNNYQRTYEVGTINIPMQIQWVSSKPRKIGAFLGMGLNISIPVKSTVTQNGNIQYYGYYEDHPESIKELYIEELGYFSDEYVDVENKITSTSYSLSFLASAGVSIPIGYFFTLKAGPELLWGLTDIYNTENTLDIFKKEVDNKATIIRNYGFSISLNYKF